MFFPFFWNTWQLMLTRPYMCIHHNQSSQPEDGFSPLGHKVGTILHACYIILLLLVFLLLMMKMIWWWRYEDDNDGDKCGAMETLLFKIISCFATCYMLLFLLLILSLGVFRSNSVWAFSFHTYFSGTLLFPISSKAVSWLTVAAHLASLLRFESLRDC